MREYKFRAWDNYHQEMINWDQYKSELVSDDFINHGQGPLVVMQYTGLKDDNGKEIYEGDIVKCTDGEGEVSKLNSDTGIGQIEWNKEWGFWNISNIKNGLGDIIYHGFVEIVGNVYENKELLKGEE